jgi:hypothetical protein
MDAFGDIRSMMQQGGGWSPTRGHTLTRALAGWADPDDLIERVWPYVVSHLPEVGVWRTPGGVERAAGTPLVVADLERRELLVASGSRVEFVRGASERASWEQPGAVVAIAGGWGEWAAASQGEVRSWGAGPPGRWPRAGRVRVEAFGEWSWASGYGEVEWGALEGAPTCALRAGWEARVDAGPMDITTSLTPGSWSIGRSRMCELQINVSGVAKRHAQIEIRRDEERGIVGELVDLQTTNGTYINGRRITVHELRDHEIVVCASTAVTLRRVMWAVG